MVSDIVLTRELPEELKKSVAAYVGCIAGAVSKEEYLGIIKKAGFTDVKVVEESPFPLDYVEDPAVKEVVEGLGMTKEEVKKAAGSVVSIKVHGRKT
jgi:arsenite methyltransferase